jgi:hypothetical protein
VFFLNNQEFMFLVLFWCVWCLLEKGDNKKSETRISSTFSKFMTIVYYYYYSMDY